MRTNNIKKFFTRSSIKHNYFGEKETIRYIHEIKNYDVAGGLQLEYDAESDELSVISGLKPSIGSDSCIFEMYINNVQMFKTSVPLTDDLDEKISGFKSINEILKEDYYLLDSDTYDILIFIYGNNNQRGCYAKYEMKSKEDYEIVFVGGSNTEESLVVNRHSWYLIESRLRRKIESTCFGRHELVSNCGCSKKKDNNIAPVAVNDELQQITSTESILFDIVNNDTDDDGENSELKINSVSLDSGNGTLSLINERSISFVPDKCFNGEATISYTIIDGNGGISNTGVVTIPVRLDESIGIGELVIDTSDMLIDVNNQEKQIIDTVSSNSNLIEIISYTLAGSNAAITVESNTEIGFTVPDDEEETEGTITLKVSNCDNEETFTRNIKIEDYESSKDVEVSGEENEDVVILSNWDIFHNLNVIGVSEDDISKLIYDGDGVLNLHNTREVLPESGIVTFETIPLKKLHQFSISFNIGNFNNWAKNKKIIVNLVNGDGESIDRHEIYSEVDDQATWKRFENNVETEGDTGRTSLNLDINFYNIESIDGAKIIITFPREDVTDTALMPEMDISNFVLKYS